MFLSKVSVNRPVTITMLILVFVVFGSIAYFSLSYNLMPDVDLPVVAIQTVYPGAGPEEIESQITKKIEDAISTVSDIDYIQSFSLDNASFVLTMFKKSKNVDVANQEIKDKIDMIINNFPADAQKPIVLKVDLTAMPVMNLVLSGNQSLLELSDYAENTLKDRLSQIPGVGQVDLEGQRKREIHVELTDQSVYQNSISMLQLSQILAAYNLDLPAGNFKYGKQEVSVKIKGQLLDADEIANLDIPTATGIKKFNQIANIRDTGEEVRKRSTYYNLESNQKYDNVVRINVLKSSDGNPVAISKALQKELSAILASMPEGMSLDIVNDSSIFIESSVSDTLSNIYMGIILTGLVLLFFLYDLRSTIIVAISMPVSIIATFSVIKLAGFSMNIMTLLGLSSSVGTLVANSVVVLENIFHHKSMGKKNKDAAQIGTSEIAIAVLASALTNVVVYLPIGMMSSVAGQFFKEFALTVTFATVFSIIISFTLTPMLASVILPENPKKGKLSRALEKLFKSWERFYKRVLVNVMRRKSRSAMYLALTIILF
ncbi:MAG: efflux RND transporter permease subunit, partial [Candidatus Cloacimonetes bacterium]|nr:efflux RND transporter permease subunit [Candidatus Cloacimonadota bacterium]